ncbi:MAG: SAM-dependent methyltransferase, partial [Verrucomicrobiota bacterium]|nr:SAM-dependent methyltransferase [Verrucomicrobiota bacterium]
MIEHLRATIRTRGPVTFAWFMEQALYHPTHGYYSSGRCSIGRRGDYYTSVSVGPVFGRLLAAQFAEMWTSLERCDDFTIVEQGAHDGALARDILEAARQQHPEFFAALRYEIVEPFPLLQARQRETLASLRGKIRWHSALADLPQFRGVHFSNELIDALPVHLVKWDGAQWQERHVANTDDGFAFVDLELSDPALAECLARIDGPLPAGYETEINLQALAWIGEVSDKLTQGFILTVDYGFSRDEFFSPHRTTGTVRAFAQHQVIPSPLERVGAADITTHVEWTSLAERAEANGM